MSTNWLTTVRNTGLLYSIVVFNVVSKWYDLLYEWSVKSYSAIQDVHSEKVWVFMERNGQASFLREDWVQSEGFELEMKYYKNDKIFVGNAGGTRKKKMDDILGVKLVSSESVKDLTEYFFGISWKAGAPSLREMITICFLEENIPVSSKMFEGLVLDVSMIDETISISLSDEKTLVPFNGWKEMEMEKRE